MGRAPRSSRSPRAHGASARAVSALALALALTSQLTVLVHMAAVKHETCAEHGELVERHGPPPSPGAQNVVALDADALAALPGESDEHDHCPLGTTPQQTEAPLAFGLAVAVAGPVDDVTAPLVRIVRVSVLHAAPKTSPPALV